MEKKYTKADLMGEIERAWTNLSSALDNLSPEQMTDIRDPEGWAVKDHLVHMAAWERSVVELMQGRPRHIGLGIDEQIYNSGDDDTINAAIQESQKDVPLSEALANLRDVHGRLLALLGPMSDDDLYRANSDFLPKSTGERDERPILGLIYANTAEHFSDHQGWIESLASQGR